VNIGEVYSVCFVLT